MKKFLTSLLLACFVLSVTLAAGCSSGSATKTGATQEKKETGDKKDK